MNRRIRVLIADDHEIVRHGLRDILTARLEKVTVREASSGEEVLGLIHNEEWDLVLLDINMPGCSGFDVLETSRRLRPSLPVLVLTAYPEEQFAVRAFKSGAAGYLTKQSATNELITAVQRLLAGGKYVTASLAERLAASLSETTAGSSLHEALSHRELQVLRLVALGKSIKEIATALALSEKTVATYRARIGEKTGLKTNVEIARYALKQALVE